MKTTHSKNTTNARHKQHLAFPTYDEEDILNLDAVIVTPPPRQSRTIRVKLGSVYIFFAVISMAAK